MILKLAPFRHVPSTLHFPGKISETEMQVTKDSNASRSSPPLAAEMNDMHRSAYKQGSPPLTCPPRQSPLPSGGYRAPLPLASRRPPTLVLITDG